jgi:hypothetical protein
MTRYLPEIEQYMRGYYETLSENDRRRYAGIEAMKLGRGGTTYIAKVLGCSPQTVRKGRSEIVELSREAKKKERQETDQKARRGPQAV